VTDVALERGLPANVDAERLVLGAILIDDTLFPQAAAGLSGPEFSIEKHRRIFAGMHQLHARIERIDRVTVANELQALLQLESVGGLTYLASLDEGLPTLVNFDSYVRIVREKYRLRALILQARKLTDLALLDNGTPARELAANFTQDLAGVASSDAENKLSSADEILTACGGVRRFTHPLTDGSKGIETGFRRFDQMTGGMQRGDLVVLAARPSMGKTALALNIAHHVAVGSQRLPVAVFSLEMSQEALLGRLLCAAARVDSSKQRAGYTSRDEQARLALASEQLRAAPLFIDDTSGTGLMDMHAKLRRLKSERGLSLVVVDYLQLMSSHGRPENRNQEISTLSRGLKLLAKDLGVPILVLSQLSRAPETRPGDHRPQLSDLRESGSIEQDADLVAFIFREEVYKPDREDLHGLAELLLAKQRNGPTGRVNLVFLKELTRFEDRAAHWEGETAP
jgi:replicative DNA helicase